jgi:hypothetical protein
MLSAPSGASRRKISLPNIKRALLTDARIPIFTIKTWYNWAGITKTKRRIHEIGKLT